MSHFVFVIHVSPLTMLVDSIEELTTMPTSLLRDRLRDAKIHMLMVDDEKPFTEADWNPDGIVNSAVFTGISEDDVRNTAFTFLQDERHYADYVQHIRGS